MAPLKPVLLALALALAAPPASADPSPQLVALVQARLPFYGIEVDVSQFDTPTVVALYSALNQRDGYFAKRRRLRTILRNPGHKQ